MTTLERIHEKLEEIKMKTVVRDGKKKKVPVPKEGYKVVDGKYVKMSSKEKTKRSKSATKAAKGKKSKQSQITKKRNKSIKRK